jgi:hypothetical protein
MSTNTKLKRIAYLSASDPNRFFECIMHHVNEGSLKVIFNRLYGKKAVGIDGVRFPGKFK